MVVRLCCSSLRYIFWVGAAVSHPDLTSWEPLDSEYWSKSVSANAPHPVSEFDAVDMSRGEFDRLVRDGQIFVVRGTGRGLPMESWDCNYFKDDGIFRDVLAHREYGAASSSQPEWMRLGDLSAAAAAEDNGQLSPYYLGIKDAGHQSPEDLASDPQASATWSEEVLKKVQSHTTVPSFMSPKNAEYLLKTPELWFSLGKAGGGARAHVDQHTESTMSLQLSGRKRWRVAPIPRRAAPHVTKLYQDGQVDGRDEAWNFLADIVLEPGDAMFFPPGSIHATGALPGTCASSITWQFNEPAPSAFWRRFMPRIRFTPDLVHTWQILARMAVPSGSDIDGDGVLSSHELQRVCRKWAETAAFFLDVDGDGLVAESERVQVSGMWEALEAKIQERLPKELRKAGLGYRQVVEDDDHLREFSKPLQKAVRRWEEQATAEDLHLTARSEL